MKRGLSGCQHLIFVGKTIFDWKMIQTSTFSSSQQISNIRTVHSLTFTLTLSHHLTLDLTVSLWDLFCFLFFEIWQQVKEYWNDGLRVQWQQKGYAVRFGHKNPNVILQQNIFFDEKLFSTTSNAIFRTSLIERGFVFVFHQYNLLFFSFFLHFPFVFFLCQPFIRFFPLHFYLWRQVAYWCSVSRLCKLPFSSWTLNI